MTPLEPPKTYNVKCRFRIQEKLSIPEELEPFVTTHSNFVVLRLLHFVITSFYKAKSVNVTGVRNFDDLEKARQAFNDFIKPKIKVEKEDVIVDCSTSSGRTNQKVHIDLPKIQADIDGEKIGVSYNPHYFPGAVIRRKKKGTVILFRTGSYIILGSKSAEEVHDSFRSICKLIKRVCTVKE